MQDSLIYRCGLQLFLYYSTQNSQYKLEVDDSPLFFICRYNLFQVARTITPNVIFYLPRNVDLVQAEELSWLYCPPLEMEVLIPF